MPKSNLALRHSPPKYLPDTVNALIADYTQVQFMLGLMYDIGEGVGQDYGEAVKWYRKSS